MARQFYFKKSNSPFKDLPAEKVIELTQAYQSATTVKEIIKDIKGVNPQTFYRSLPYIKSEIKCEKCNHPVYVKVPPRTYSDEDEKKLCLNCHHDYTTKCNCEYCKAERKQRYIENKAEYERQGREWIKNQSGPAYKPGEISLLEEIQLVLVVRKYGNKDGIIEFDGPALRGYPEYKIIIRQHRDFVLDMIDKKLLIPVGYLKYEANSYKNKEGKHQFTLYPTECLWKINIDFDNDLSSYIQSIEEKKYTSEELALLWKHIYRKELRQYLDYHNDYYLKNWRDINLLDVFLDDLMEHFSLAKAYAIVYYTSTSCLRYITKYDPTTKALKTRFLNLLKENIESNIGNPNLKDFNRLDLKITDIQEYILKDVFNQASHFFNLKSKDFLSIVNQ